MAYIYAILKENNGTLRKIAYYVCTQQNVSIQEMCNYHDYAPYMDAQYGSCLAKIPENALTFVGRSIRKEAVEFERASQKIKKEYQSIIAQSHRRGGWYGVNWNFNEDISFLIESNFGYGSVSYFYAKFKYKDVLLTPYSFYVKYKHSTYASVIKCTYEYRVCYESWEQVMSDCIEFYNAIVFNDSTYVFTWLDKQLREMISALEKFIYASSGYFQEETINRSHVSGFAEISGDDFWIIKAEKIANSLNFIESIKELPSQIDSATYIKRIRLVCNSFLPLLNDKIAEVSQKYQSQENRMKKLCNSGDYPIYEKFYSKYYLKKKWYLSTNKYSMLRFLLDLNARLDSMQTIDVIKKRIAKLNLLKKEIDNLRVDMQNTKFMLDALCVDRNKIVEY